MKDYKAKILKLLKKNPGYNVLQISRELSISPQLVSYHLSGLRKEGKINKTGSTRSAQFYLPSQFDKKPLKVEFKRELKNLEEDKVFNEVNLKLRLKNNLNSNAFQIIQYAFTEMLNNAIDHSASRKVSISFEIKEKNVEFEIKDEGVGLIPKIQNAFKFSKPLDALEHVLKGKQTTDLSNHSGQGIFFTSRVVDHFELQSLKFIYIVDNQKNDKYLKESRAIKGTRVKCDILKNTRRQIKKIFEEFSDEEYVFDKSSITIKLGKENGLLSRSQAKRFLIGLDSFKRIIFDFKGVKNIGQGFADEIFRVYARNNPDKLLLCVNAVEVVSFMVEKAKKETF